ncbi:unnamed protein product [Moneuplotes crassus]|uniref:Origin recognition complex subunit 4 C-terminal domain-containing protein n=1 Tax=Euplotes crassus TaxID=5936 RepID=A0AAD1X7Z6_EUPCR|nr:unnamed protein product [Moneuplotes crassus]
MDYDMQDSSNFSSSRYSRGSKRYQKDVEMESDNGVDDEEAEFLKGDNLDSQPSTNSRLLVRSMSKSLRNLKECEERGIDPEDFENEQHSRTRRLNNREESKRGDTKYEEIRIDPEKQKRNIEQVEILSNVISKLILRLSNFTSMYVGTKFFYEQYDTVMEMLNRFIYNENQSMILMSRSNTVLHQFISKIRDDLNAKLKEEDSECDVRTVRINSILTTKETAILNHFAECLGMDSVDKQGLSQEMKERMEDYFKQFPNIAVIFILENVEYYVENSKQSLLYKILDMLQYAKIKFAFIATSQRVDIIDSFEKRIKSRFSHRQILFYSEDLDTFKECIEDTIQNIGEYDETSEQGRQFLGSLHDFIMDSEYGCSKIFQKLFDKGKDYEFLCRTLKIALSHLNSTYHSDPDMIEHFEDNGGELFRKSLDYVDNLSTSNDFKTILSRMPEAYVVVLISAKNSFQNCMQEFFNFTLAYNEYKLFVRRNQGNIVRISKETFIKIFIDLVKKGFIKTKASTEAIISVNNKMGLGIEFEELSTMIRERVNSDKEISTLVRIFSENRSGDTSR